MLSNRLRDILVDRYNPNEWFVCQPGSDTCDGFDSPCEPTGSGLVCRRTVESLHVFVRKGPMDLTEERRDITSSNDNRLCLVFILPGRWTEDERAGKAHFDPEAARAWAVLQWAGNK